MNLTDFEKSIYNTFLKHFRNGEPFTYRKDFSNLDNSTVVYLKKLSAFFAKFPHITLEEFFSAPRYLHPDEKCPTLGFFVTRPAIVAYSLAIKKKQDQSPEKQTEKIKESLRYIAMFCIKNNISLDQYLDHKQFNMPSWMQHYREHYINPYVLFELGSMDKFKQLGEEEKALWAGDFFEKIDVFRTRYHNSEKTKEYVREGIKRIKDFLKKQLQTKPN